MMSDGCIVNSKMGFDTVLPAVTHKQYQELNG